MFPGLPINALDDLIPFALVLARVAGLFAAIPVFGSRVVPARVKTPLIFSMALLIFPIVRPEAAVVATDSISLMLIVIKEVLIGLTLAILSQLIFAAVEFCGFQVGTQMGFTMGLMFDPTTQSSVPTMGMFQGALATLVFLSLDVHHFFIRAIAESYRVIPVGAWHISSGLLTFLLNATSGMFVVAIKLAAPVAVALLATAVALGIAARSFPSMNVFIVSMPLNIGIGFLVLGISLPVFVRVLGGSFGILTEQMRTLFGLLR